VFNKIALIIILASSMFANKNHIKINNAYMRTMPSNAKMSASFIEIKNYSDKDTHLTKATSNISKSTEIHKSKKLHNGMIQMKKIKNIKIPANNSATLKKGGKHIMFIKLKKPLIKNTNVNLKLDFINGLIKNLNIPVK